MRRSTRVALASLAVGLATTVAHVAPSEAGPAVASATLVDINGREVGDATFRLGARGSLVASVTVMIDNAVTANPSDFHGLHLHAGGPQGCVTHAPGTEPAPTQRFIEVGPHWSAAGQQHGAHTGDLPSLLRRGDDIATVELTLDRITVDDVIGRALVVHHLADDFGKHPGVGTSSMTGNAGPRYACGVVRATASR